jgi:hypothetical protein
MAAILARATGRKKVKSTSQAYANRLGQAMPSLPARESAIMLSQDSKCFFQMPRRNAQ